MVRPRLDELTYYRQRVAGGGLLNAAQGAHLLDEIDALKVENATLRAACTEAISCPEGETCPLCEQLRAAVLQ